MMTALIFAVKKLASKVALAMIGEKFIEWAFFEIADRIVQSTVNPHDDKWLAKIKEEYNK
ncbi:MAG: hypothetical protein ACRCZ2_03900 [Fusobacteriaceae bacterium]